ncbi:hypothetical protein BCT47_19650 [Vibrio splendidus]|uniref:Uncharacterized protein n=1 Tax=Vibrio splendidus TaxID=29497 RepID=A0AB35N062_VIBSP|nr:hypothetical protein [Vibrio splendidus]MDP2501883.1 hypothetical protein [Vibrio splendidus]PMM75367.1 hypothetical protein BCT47_19650 [Vibrio splendidus]
MKMFCNFPFYHTNEQQELTVKFIVNGSAVRFIEQKANLIKKLIMESNDHYEPSRASDRLLKFTNNLDEGDDADEYMPITVCDQWVRGVALVYSSEFGHQTDNICLNITFKSNSELVDLATSSLPLSILEKGAA